jgi:hypothetical protein
MLPVFLDCPFLIVPLVFSNVYLLPSVFPVSCVTNVSSISGLGHTTCSKLTLEKTERQSRMDSPEILETVVTQDTEHTIGSK